MQLSTNTNEMIHDMKANTVREDAKKKQQEAALQEKNDWEWLTGDVRGLRVLHLSAAFSAPALTRMR